MSYDIEHALRVAAHFTYGSDEWLIAMFHDVLEDTKLTAGHLRRGNVPERIIIGVEILTRDVFSGESYKDYIRRVYFGGAAKRVKLADLKENLKRCIDDDNESLAQRYREAIAYLES